jgi:hypothetical protein
MSIAKLKIEDNPVVLIDPCKHSRLFAGRCDVNGIAILDHETSKKESRRLVVLHNQQPHTEPSREQLKTSARLE